MPTLGEIAVHPIKALDSLSLDSAEFTDIGGLASDRIYAIVDEDGEYINGKRTDAVHRLRADIDLETREATLAHDGSEATFHLDDDRERVERWLSSYFGYDVTLEAGPGGFRTDSVVYGDTDRPGPTLVSAATLREVASWYDGIDAAEMRRRMRPNLVVEGVDPFWEERLVAEDASVRLGDARLDPIKLLPRCVVPSRNPDTGEETDGFRKTFIERRTATMPEWSPREILTEDPFKLTVLLDVPDDQRDETIHVGDDVSLEQ